MPSPRYHSPSPLPAHHSMSTSSYVGSISHGPFAHPPLSPVPLACVYCDELDHSVWQYHDYNRPCSPNSSPVHPSATAAVDSLPISNRTPIPGNAPSDPGHFQSDVPHSLQGVIPPSTPVDTQESVPQVNGPAEPIPDKGDDNYCVITNCIPSTKEYTTVGIGNCKRVKNYNANTIGQETVGSGSYGDTATKSTLVKRPFHITLGCYCKLDPQ